MTGRTGRTIYQASDLNRQGRAILDTARRGEARIRDTDGTSLVLLAEEQVQISRTLGQLASDLLTAIEANNTISEPRPDLAYGAWTWLRHLDQDDRAECIQELMRLLIIALREQSEQAVDAVQEALAGWHTTAEALADPARKAILLGTHDEGDFVEVTRPSAPKPG